MGMRRAKATGLSIAVVILLIGRLGAFVFPITFVPDHQLYLIWGSPLDIGGYVVWLRWIALASAVISGLILELLGSRISEITGNQKAETAALWGVTSSMLGAFAAGLGFLFLFTLSYGFRVNFTSSVWLRLGISSALGILLGVFSSGMRVESEQAADETDFSDL